MKEVTREAAFSDLMSTLVDVIALAVIALFLLAALGEPEPGSVLPWIALGGAILFAAGCTSAISEKVAAHRRAVAADSEPVSNTRHDK